MKLDKTDKIDRAEKILGNKLSISYNEAKTEDDRLIVVYVFGIRYAKEFREHSINLIKLLEYSKIGMQNAKALDIGIKLAEHVVDIEKIRKFLSFI
ncbi:MAG: hypothetical protein FWF56_00255 [Firmicutes bacterium]|nr:hypothetical protein [Bacillota bacterium]MCL1953530.1 hypothetical protein [Bacillota bacterium]